MTPRDPDGPWYTKAEACAYLRVSLDTLERYHASNHLPYHRVAERQTIRIHRQDLDALMVPVEKKASEE